MSHAPHVYMESPEETYIERVNRQFNDGSWSAFTLDSLKSISLSDYSHSPYGQGSQYLNTSSMIHSTTPMTEASANHNESFAQLPSVPLHSSQQRSVEGVSNSVRVDMNRSANQKGCDDDSETNSANNSRVVLQSIVQDPSPPPAHNLNFPNEKIRFPSCSEEDSSTPSRLVLPHWHASLPPDAMKITTPRAAFRRSIIPSPVTVSKSRLNSPELSSRANHQSKYKLSRSLGSVRRARVPQMESMSCTEGCVSAPSTNAILEGDLCRAEGPTTPQNHATFSQEKPCVTATLQDDSQPTSRLATATPRDSQRQTSASVSRLIAFVAEVSDPEVLHVIHDYVCEHMRGSQYQDMARVCAKLLAEKERLLAISTNKAPPTGAITALPAAHREHCSDEEEEEEVALDKFGEIVYSDSPYSYPKSTYNFAKPSVFGTTWRMLQGGMLYKILDNSGNYHFFNDTLNHVIMVRIRSVLTGRETINDRAMQYTIPGSSETEITMAVLPEDTNFLIGGCGQLWQVMAKAVPTPPDFISPSVKKYMENMNAGIDAVRAALGKWQKATDQAVFLRCCLLKKIKFTDLVFRPAAESLCRANEDTVQIPPLTWHRPEDYLALPEVSEARLFRGEISCYLVKQGQLSDHSVIGAIAAVAQFPEHILWMFRHPESAVVGSRERAVGCYRVTLLQGGWWTTLLLDNYLPASMRGPLFARCPEEPRRLWVSFLEKAYAKALGSYAALCHVDALAAMHDFTGFPVRQFTELWRMAKLRPSEFHADSLFSYIRGCLTKGYVVMLYTPPSSDASSRNTIDLARKRSSRLLPVNGMIPQLVPGHIYFLCDTAHYEELDIRMVRLRNPWTWQNEDCVEETMSERHWKYLTVNKRPETASMPAPEVSVGGSRTPVSDAHDGHGSNANPVNDRRGTMWLEWSEALSAFTGGGVCYSAWGYYPYRARNIFINGRPRWILELRPTTTTELLITLTVGVHNGGVAQAGGSAPRRCHGDVSYGVTYLLTRHQPAKRNERVLYYATDDIEHFSSSLQYFKAPALSLKATLDPAGAPYYLIPRLDPEGVHATGVRGPKEVSFVVALLTSVKAGEPNGLGIAFKQVPWTSGAFGDGEVTEFAFESVRDARAAFQYCSQHGVHSGEGHRITSSANE